MDIAKTVLREFKEPFGRPTDIIGFGLIGKNIANDILPIIGQKEICFFDEKIKSDATFHYLDFVDMLEKTEIMIFTIELPEKYYKQLYKMNKKVKIFIPKDLIKTISILKEKGFCENLFYYKKKFLRSAHTAPCKNFDTYIISQKESPEPTQSSVA